MRLVNSYDVRKKIVSELQKAGLYFEIKVSHYISKYDSASDIIPSDLFVIKGHEYQEDGDYITLRSNFGDFWEIEPHYYGFSNYGYRLEYYEMLQVWGFGFHEYFDFKISNLIPKILPYIKYGYSTVVETSEISDGEPVIYHCAMLKKEEETIDEFKKRIEEKYKGEVYSLTSYDGSVDITYKEIDY